MIIQKKTLSPFVSVASLVVFEIHAESSANLHGSGSGAFSDGNRELAYVSPWDEYVHMDRKICSGSETLQTWTGCVPPKECRQLCKKLDGCNYYSVQYSDVWSEQTCKLCSSANNPVDFVEESHKKAKLFYMVGEETKAPVGNVISAPGVATPQYSLVDQKKTFSEARAYCQLHGSDLASITNSDDNNVIAKLCKSAKSGIRCWIGLSDQELGGSPQWLDGSPYVYKNWNTAGNGAYESVYLHAVTISGTQQSWLNFGAWEYSPHMTKRPFICGGQQPLLD